MAGRLRWFACALALSLVASARTVARAGDDPPPPAPPTPGEDEPDKTRGYIGYQLEVVEALSPEGRKECKVTKEHGWWVRGIVMGSPAEKAGLKVGDIALEMNGEKLPDTSGLDPKDTEGITKFVKNVMKDRKKVKPGETATVTVERDGKPVVVSAVAIDWDTYQVLVAKEQEEAMSVKVPDPVQAGAPEAWSYDFETVPDGEVAPAGFLAVEGTWEVWPDTANEKNHWLRQHSEADPWAWVAVTGKGRAAKDGTAKVRFQLVSGSLAVAAGIVIRAADRKNWIGVRVDGVTKDLRVVRVKDGKTERLSAVDVGSPKLGQWHTLEVTFSGGSIVGLFDGDKKVEAKDEAPAFGWAGLMTATDAESVFDDFSLAPATGK